MIRAVVAALAALTVGASSQTATRNIWAQQYKDRTPEAMAAQFEEPSRPIFRYRAAMAGLMQIKPGMIVADIGAGSGFFARALASKVGPDGRVYATELDERMVEYIRARAKQDGLANLVAVKGEVEATGLEAASVDAASLIATYSFLDRPGEILRSVAEALRPKGLLLIVDTPQTGTGAEASGAEAEDVIAAAKAAGFTLVDESAVVPGHYALRFRRE